jgi:YegS/Rv2252/BmrU family lipid kinase
MTKEPGHAITLAQAAAEAGFETVAAAGGDGTVHEVANGILRADRPEVCFGVLPMGSGNDYARVLGVPFDPRQMVARVLSRESWSVDVGEITADGGQRQRYFVNTAGFVMSGAVTWEARRIRQLRGLWLYGLATLRALCRHFRAAPTYLALDRQEVPTPTLYLAIAIGRAEGGGFVVAPQAQLDDGWFDYLHAGSMSRWQALSYLPRMLTGNLPADDPRVRRGRCQRVTLACPEPVMAHVDGELFATPLAPARHFEIRLHPRRLRIRGPKACSSSPDC